MTQSNLERYKKDLADLVAPGYELLWAMQKERDPKKFKELYKKEMGEKYDEWVKKIPRFANKYQTWYSEAQAVIKQILPDRLGDFISHYKRPSNRKVVEYDTYFIEDYLQGLQVTRGGDVIVDGSAAVPRFTQQLEILKSAQRRFQSSLFDIRQLVQADLLDSEIEAARVLRKSGFHRAAGAVAGVVLEKHLAQVCDNHEVKITKKHPTIADLNDALKKDEAIETPQWRSIQHLGDLRNLCDHNKDREPKPEEIDDLINGTEKLIKTLF